jgi:hypothetical protein
VGEKECQEGWSQVWRAVEGITLQASPRAKLNITSLVKAGLVSDNLNSGQLALERALPSHIRLPQGLPARASRELWGFNFWTTVILTKTPVLGVVCFRAFMQQ